MKLNKKPEKFKKIRSMNFRLWLNFSLFSLLIVFLVTFISYFIIGGVFTSQIQSRLETTGKDVIEVISRYQPAGAPLIDDYIKQAEEREDAIILLITKRGEAILPFESSLENGDEVVKFIESKLTFVDDNTAVIFNGNDSLNYVAQVDYGEKCYLLIRYELTLINSTTRTLRNYLFIISSVVLVIAFIISYSVAQKLSTPIKSMSATAEKMAKGNYEVNFVATDYQEVAQLADTLNYAKDEIKKSEIFQKELLANVSHDLKTPLTMIKAYASMIKEISGDNPEKREQHLNVIIDEADRLTGLVNDVLNVSKISSNIDTINKKVFNLTEFLYGVISKFDYLRETQGYSFMVDIDTDLYTFADEEKIGQVIYNLVSNAVNYTGEDKTVYISLKNDPINDRIKFSVKDTGVGISKENLHAIWERYYRVKEEHARPVKGSGLGLYIVKNILNKHSFEFGADSEKGKGSIFWINFPTVSPNIET
ncbi:MAG: HAMP domain-containing histidine kinase [Clostridia bacterium]|nr:HAMP domain-containing histidine kinase [Clostridia bacterium]